MGASVAGNRLLYLRRGPFTAVTDRSSVRRRTEGVRAQCCGLGKGGAAGGNKFGELSPQFSDRADSIRPDTEWMCSVGAASCSMCFVLIHPSRVPPNGCKILFDWGLEAETRAKTTIGNGFSLYKCKMYSSSIKFI